jgi:PadR family transcriptional regulator PadR
VEKVAVRALGDRVRQRSLNRRFASPVPRSVARPQAVLAAFLQGPATDRYGLDLMNATGMPSGTLYPILARLRQAGWVRAEWETRDPDAARPARRYYRLTPHGVTAARQSVAQLYQQLGRATKTSAKPRPA